MNDKAGIAANQDYGRDEDAAVKALKKHKVISYTLYCTYTKMANYIIYVTSSRLVNHCVPSTLSMHNTQPHVIPYV